MASLARAAQVVDVTAVDVEVVGPVVDGLVDEGTVVAVVVVTEGRLVGVVVGVVVT